MNCYNCGESLSKSTVVAKKNEIRFNCYNSRKQIIKCNNCKLVQLVPQWSEKELEKIYQGYNQQQDFVGQKVTSKRITPYLESYIKNKNDYILEVGCGTGDNLKILKNKGYRVIGIDKDPSVCDNKIIFNIDYHILEDKDLQYNLPQFIYGIQLFEHLSDPINFIEKMANLLNKYGTLLLELPNLEDPLLTLYNIKEFKQFYYRPDHHFFYTPDTILDMLYRNKVNNSCSIKRIQNYGLVNHLNWLFRKKPTNLKINIPIIDNIYKFILTNILKKSDTILLIIKKEH